jgi:diguanylate cyclase (GGDEF)-like protein/PAS domain S-box-containing protein
MMNDAAALQVHLQRRRVFLALFNSGVIVYQTDGTAVAEIPLTTGRVGHNYADRDYLMAALQGRATIGKPHVSKSGQFAEFLISAPIRDPSGQVIGALAGITNLTQTNFLDPYMAPNDGAVGSYLLMSAAHRLTITATGRRALIEPLPAAGVMPMLDHFLQGAEGTAVMKDPQGQSVLAAYQQVPVANWVLAVVLPTDLAFAPIHKLQQRMLLTTLLMTLLAALLTWWLLKRELSPMLSAVHTLAELADSDQTPQLLPIARRDEVGKLIDGFNRLLTKLLATQQKLLSLYVQAPLAVIEWDMQFRVVRWNPAAEKMFGHSAAEAMGQAAIFIIPPAHHALVGPVLQALLAGSGGGRSDNVNLRKDGKTIQCRWYNTSLRNASGQVVGVTSLVEDITEQAQAAQDLRIAATAFESQQGMTIADASGNILRVNRAFTQITGYEAAEVLGQNPRMMASGRHDGEFYKAMWGSITQNGTWQGEIWNRRKDGVVYPQWLSISAVNNAAGQTTHYVATFSDITVHKKAEAQINSLAFFDPLTKLPNRRLLLDRLEQALLTCARRGSKGALMYVDLDNFKTLNETLGHVQGDLLLAMVAMRLSGCVREGDTVARIGGDEFVVMLEDLNDDEVEAATHAEIVASKISLALNKRYPLGPFEHHSSPSIGITLFAGGTSDAIDEPLKRAELAMYQAKAAGRNTLRFFETQMQVVVTVRAALEADLREAVLNNQFVLHYQAQVVGADRLVGAEVLVRWQHPQRGLVSPFDFIPLAEETGLILPLGQWVLETACLQLAAWAAQPAMAHLTLAVNVSAKQFQQTDFVAQVLATLARTGAAPKRLKLELTESLLVDNVEGIIAKMAALKTHGVGFSLDDFGTGYSSLSYLKRLPLDQLKIDQGFVRNILTDTNDAAIAKMVVALAESMGLAVIAEGVEIEAQREFLAHLGCHAYQGYYFSRPIALAAFEALAQRTPPVLQGAPLAP